MSTPLQKHIAALRTYNRLFLRSSAASDLELTHAHDALVLTAFLLPGVEMPDGVAVPRAAPSTSQAAPVPDSGALLLIELQAIRAELTALRKHAGAPIAKIADSERFAHMPPPAGAELGHWEAPAGQALPVWIETPAPVYDPASGAVVGGKKAAGAPGVLKI